MRHMAAKVCGTRRAVLVLDDEPVVLRVVAAALGQNGFEVLTAERPEEARGLFHTHADALCLAVIDLALTGMTGVDFVNSLPTLTPRIPILFITGLGDVEAEDTLPPNSAVLHKPFKVDALMNAIYAVVSPTSAASSQASGGTPPG